MDTTATIKEILTVKETADLLGLSKHSIYRMIKEQVIPFSSFGKNGRTKRFQRKKLLEWFDGRSVEGKV